MNAWSASRGWAICWGSWTGKPFLSTPRIVSGSALFEDHQRASRDRVRRHALGNRAAAGPGGFPQAGVVAQLAPSQHHAAVGLRPVLTPSRRERRLCGSTPCAKWHCVSPNPLAELLI